MFDILNIKIDKNDIVQKREEISKQLMIKSSNIDNENINDLSISDLELLFKLYDQMFFEDWFNKNYKGKMKFSLSRRMTKSAGMTICPKFIDRVKPKDLVIEIRIGVDFFYQYDLVEGNKTVCGIKTSNNLEALHLVFEHELCHVIEFINFKKSKCSGKRFKTIANNMFGHTAVFHKLPTNRQIAKQNLGLNIGDTVSFTFKGEELTGILNNINKRATVLVKNKKGPLRDNKGNRYFKHYVPLVNLK